MYQRQARAEDEPLATLYKMKTKEKTSREHLMATYTEHISSADSKEKLIYIK